LKIIQLNGYNIDQLLYRDFAKSDGATLRDKYEGALGQK